MKCLLGKDFNFKTISNLEGRPIRRNIKRTSYEICNCIGLLPIEKRYTFRNVLGVKRVLDYYVVLLGIPMICFRHINDLDLQSNYTLIQTCIKLPPERKHRTQNKRIRKINWNTYLDAGKKMEYDLIHTLPTLEKVLRDVNDACPKEDRNNLKC